MPIDLGEELRGAAPRPAREVPLALIEQRLRTRRRRRFGAVACAAAVVVAGIGGGAVALSGGDGPSIRSTRPAQTPTAGADVTVDLPPGWVQSPTYPDAYTGHPPLVAVGTTTVPSLPQSCFWSNDLDDDAFVNIGEFSPDSLGPSLANPPPHPQPLASAVLASTDGCAGATPDPGTVGTAQSHRYVFVFAEDGRVFRVQLSLGSTVSEQRRAEAAQVLNSLRVNPLKTSTVVVPSPTTTVPPSTTPAPMADAEAIRETFRIWLDTKPRDDPAIGKVIEDYESIRASIEQAAAIAPLPLDGYHGRVDAVGLVDADHAVVQYAILNGQSVVYEASGRAVRVDGVWKVSRETVCDALAVGGTICPPRS